MTRINRKALAISAVAAALMIQSIFIAAGAGTKAAPLANLNLASERRSLNSFGDSLSRIETTFATLDRKASINPAEHASARSQAEDTKRLVSQAQQSIRSVIAKLKAAGQWDSFDGTLVGNITDARIRSIIQSNGGPKRILEDAASQFPGLSPELDSLVQSLSAKVHARLDPRPATGLSRQVLRVAFNPEPAPFRFSLRCSFRQVQYIVDIIRGTEDTPSGVNHLDQLIAACDSTAT